MVNSHMISGLVNYKGAVQQSNLIKRKLNKNLHTIFKHYIMKWKNTAIVKRNPFTKN
jgi:predicted  nucleic acid-binding Zn-ribbon protein